VQPPIVVSGSPPRPAGRNRGIDFANFLIRFARTRIAIVASALLLGLASGRIFGPSAALPFSLGLLAAYPVVFRRPLSRFGWVVVAFLVAVLGLSSLLSPLNRVNTPVSGSMPGRNVPPLASDSMMDQNFLVHTSGGPVSGAMVRAVPGTGDPVSARTGSDGVATLYLDLASGNYDVTATAVGYDQVFLADLKVPHDAGPMDLLISLAGTAQLRDQSLVAARVILSGVKTGEDAIRVALAHGSVRGGIDSRDEISSVDENSRIPDQGVTYFRDGNLVGVRQGTDAGKPAILIVTKNGGQIYVQKECGNLVPGNLPPSVLAPTAPPQGPIPAVTPTPRPTAIPMPSPSKVPGNVDSGSHQDPGPTPTSAPISVPSPGSGSGIVTVNAAGCVVGGGCSVKWSSDYPGRVRAWIWCDGKQMGAMQYGVGPYSTAFTYNSGSWPCRAYVSNGTTSVSSQFTLVVV
jgi:hypothetical protein